MISKILFLIFFFISGCTTTKEFQIGKLDCSHIVSTQLMGTAQIVSCSQGKQPIYLNSFEGTAGIQPLIEASKAGAAYGILRNLPTIQTENIVNVHP